MSCAVFASGAILAQRQEPPGEPNSENHTTESGASGREEEGGCKEPDGRTAVPVAPPDGRGGEMEGEAAPQDLGAVEDANQYIGYTAFGEAMGGICRSGRVGEILE